MVDIPISALIRPVSTSSAVEPDSKPDLLDVPAATTREGVRAELEERFAARSSTLFLGADFSDAISFTIVHRRIDEAPIIAKGNRRYRRGHMVQMLPPEAWRAAVNHAGKLEAEEEGDGCFAPDDAEHLGDCADGLCYCAIRSQMIAANVLAAFLDEIYVSFISSKDEKQQVVAQWARAARSDLEAERPMIVPAEDLPAAGEEP